MTSKSPRIYVYKITFLEVFHYYYGSHKEKRYNEYYVGSPITHKDFWKFYTPIKQIIKEFPFTDGGYIEARKFEDSLIKPVYNNDPLCLNEACGGRISLDVCRRNGQKHKENKTGFFSLSAEELSNNGRKGGRKGKGKKNSISCRQKISCSVKGEKNGMYGKKHSSESIEKIRKSRLENNPSRRKLSIILIHPNGKEEIFESAIDACNKYGLNRSKICMVLKGQRSHHKKFKAKYL